MNTNTTTQNDQDHAPKIMVPNTIALLPADLSRGQISVITLILLNLQQQIYAKIDDNGADIQTLFRREMLSTDGSLQMHIIHGEYGIDYRWFRTIQKSSAAFGGHITIARAMDVGRRASCMIRLSSKALDLFLDMSKGYFYADPRLSIRPENKSDVRMYWLTQMYATMKGFTMSIPQLRSILGASKSYEGYFTFEDHIISHAQRTLSFMYEHNMSAVRFSFVRIYNHPHKYIVAGGSPANGHGKPDALKFTITTKDTKDANDEKKGYTESKANASAADKEVVRILREELHLPEKMAIVEAARVSSDCREAFINFAISLKEVIDSKKSRGENLKNPLAYVCKCLHNYFLQRDAKEKAIQQRQAAKQLQQQKVEQKILEQKKISEQKNVELQRPELQKNRQGMGEESSIAAKPVDKPRRPFAEWAKMWQQVMAEYDGPAKDALLRATFKGEERDVFCVQFASKADKEQCEKDYQRLNIIARRVLKLQSRFQPGVVMDVKHKSL